MKVIYIDENKLTTFLDNVTEIKEIKDNKIDIDYKPNKYIIRSIRVNKEQIVQITL